MTILIEQLRSSLENLADPKSVAAANTPFTELVCQVFDDTGVSDSIEDGTLEQSVGRDVAAGLLELNGLVDAADQSLEGAEFLEQPAMQDIVSRARHVLRKLGGFGSRQNGSG